MIENFRPAEMLFDILVRLPPEDLVRCLCVSKAWNATIHDRQFIKVHLQRSLETNEFRTLLFRGLFPSSRGFFSLPFHDENNVVGGSREVLVQTVVPAQLQRYDRILGNCNGLLCVRNGDNGEIALWNPSIRKFKMIPTTPTTERSTLSSSNSKRMYGFGYDSVNDDHKIVQAVEFLDEVDHVVVSNQVNVYSLNSNSWKTIQNLPYIGYQFVRFVVLRKMLFLNGAVIWLMQNKKDYKKHIIVTLDLATHKYHEFPAPVDGENNSMLELEVLREALYALMLIVSIPEMMFGPCFFLSSRTLGHFVVANLCSSIKQW